MMLIFATQTIWWINICRIQYQINAMSLNTNKVGTASPARRFAGEMESCNSLRARTRALCRKYPWNGCFVELAGYLQSKQFDCCREKAIDRETDDMTLI